jgi:tetratricopeptide (TPR) repeat protein
MFPFRPTLDQFSLIGARVLGRLIGRPSDGLLTQLAARDREARPSTPGDSPMVAASDHIQLGQSAFAAAAYGEALHHFGTALSHAPDAPWAWHGRGDALQLSGQHEAALEAYRKAIANDDATGLHHAGAANALRALGQDEAAQDAWTAALERDPSLIWMQAGSKKP